MLIANAWHHSSGYIVCRTLCRMFWAALCKLKLRKGHVVWQKFWFLSKKKVWLQIEECSRALKSSLERQLSLKNFSGTTRNKLKFTRLIEFHFENQKIWIKSSLAPVSLSLEELPFWLKIAQFCTNKWCSKITWRKLILVRFSVGLSSNKPVDQDFLSWSRR